MFETPLSLDEFIRITINELKHAKNAHPNDENYWKRFVYNSLLGLKDEETKNLIQINPDFDTYVMRLKDRKDQLKNSIGFWIQFDRKLGNSSGLDKIDFAPIDNYVREIEELEYRIREVSEHSNYLASFLALVTRMDHMYASTVNTLHDKQKSGLPEMHETRYLPLFRTLKANISLYGSIDNVLMGVPKEIF